MKKAVLVTVLILVPGLAGIASAELVAYYEFEGNANDSSGNGLNGTAYGGPGYVGGVFGKAISLDGVDDFVDCGTYNPSEATGELSVCVWAKWDGLNGRWQGLVAKRDTWAADDMMWQLEAHIDTGALEFKREGSYWYSGDPVLPVGEWAHVAATFDGTTCKLYVDGTQTGSGSFSSGSDPEAHVIIGATQPNGANAFAGDLDDVRIYNHALSAVAIGLVMEPPEAPSDANSFTYQGRLLDADSPADGLYDFQFKLYDNPSILGNQQGEAIHMNDVDVIDGYFAVELNFGSELFDGNNRWLQIGVRPGELDDPSEYTVLSPLQQLTRAPYAIYAEMAGEAMTGAGGADDAWKVVGENMFAIPTGNVGIGTTAPDVKLEVNGQVKITGGSPGEGKVLTSDTTGLASWQTSSGGGDNLGNHTATQNIKLNGNYVSGDGENEGIFVDDIGQVGIGTSSPGHRLEVRYWSLVPAIKAVNAGRGAGVYGESGEGSGIGVSGRSDKGSGVHGSSSTGIGVFGISDSGGGVYGRSHSSGIGVSGVSVEGDGIYGWTSSGRGVYGSSDSGYAGYFEGPRNYFSGSVGIGTISPDYTLDVAGPANFNKGKTGAALRVNGSEAIWYDGVFFSWGYGGSANYFADPVGIGRTNPSYKLDVNGTIRGDNVSPSDERLKKEVVRIDDALEKVGSLRGVYFKWDNEEKTQGVQMGVIAQEVEAVFSEAVSTDDEGYKSVAYGRLVAPLIEAVKELKAENDALKRRLEAVETQIRQGEPATLKEVRDAID